MTRVNSTGKESSSNFSPDNGTGLAVRTAIKDIFESLRTVNSAAGDPSGAANLAAYQLHIDSDTDTLKIRNGANSAFVTLGNVSQTNFGFLSATGGTLTGVLTGSTGSESAPSINFGDSNTGFFKKSTNQIGISTAGTEQLFLDQNGITLNDQNEIRFSESTSNGSNYIIIKAPSSVASNRTLTLPDETGTILTSSTNINSTSVTGVLFALGSTSISRGDTITELAGVSTVKVTTIKDTSGNNSSTTEQIAQGRAKIWCAFDQSTINDSFGVTSVTDNGTGSYTVNFSSSFSNTNYCAVVTGGNGTNSPCGVAIMEKTTSTIRISTTGMNVAINQLSDSSLTGLAIFAD